MQLPCFCALSVFIFAAAVQADILNVPDPYPTIQAAVDIAVPGDEVVVADGTYTGMGNRDIDFGGLDIIVRSQNGPDFCTIDCQQMGRAFYFHNGETTAALVKGFTITNGFTNDRGGAVVIESASPTFEDVWFVDNSAESAGYATGNGGAVYCRTGSPVFTDCDFLDNRAVTTVPDPNDPPFFDATGLGGAIFVIDGSTVTITGGDLIGNRAMSPGLGGNGLGGAIFVAESNPTSETLESHVTVVGSRFEENGASLAGGAIWVQGVDSAPEPDYGPSTLTVANGIFERNWGQSGGAIAGFSFAGLTVDQSQFIENYTVEDIVFFLPGVQEGLGGGAIGAALFSTMTITESMFRGNMSLAGYGGAVSTSFGNTTTIDRSRFFENTAALAGGALSNDALAVLFGGFPASTTVINTLMACNATDGVGGAAYNGGGSSLNMASVTVAHNSAAFGAGAVENTGAGSSVVMCNSIVWGNEARKGVQLTQLDGATTTVTYSIIKRGWPGIGNLKRSPRFVHTSEFCDPADSYRLSRNSPAIDSGDNEAMLPGMDFDLDGNPRFVDDPRTPDQGNGEAPICDMGAYEFQTGVSFRR